MRADLYQAETERFAREQVAILDEVRVKLEAGKLLSPLEQGGVLHALQVLTENAIGKAKHLLKFAGELPPASAYDAFASLARIGLVKAESHAQWNNVIGLRNWIVHGYTNFNMSLILALVKTAQYRFIYEFLVQKTAQ